MPGHAKGRPRTLSDRSQGREAVLEYPDRQYHRAPARHRHLDHPGRSQDARLGRRADRLQRRRRNPIVDGQRNRMADPAKRIRLRTAKQFQHGRIDYLRRVWAKDKDLKTEGFDADDEDIAGALANCAAKIDIAKNVTELLLTEAQLTKSLYKAAVKRTQQSDFSRNAESVDDANVFLNHGNYLAYGLGATTLWVLGIPHGFAVMHGKTRRGALVFDVADLVKDTLILPWAFISAKEKTTEQEFRQQILQKFTEHKALDFMFECVKQVASQSWESNE